MVRKLGLIVVLTLVAGGAGAATVAPVLPLPDVARRCTDRGALSLWRDGEGVRGTLGSLRVSGSEAALVVSGARGESVWTGAAAALGGVAVPEVDPAALARVYAAAGKLKAKGTHVKGKGVKAEVDAEGVLRGTLRGDAAAWALAGEGVFGGTAPPGAPLARLPRKLKHDDPFSAREADPVAAFAQVVADHAARVGVSLACSAGGTTQFDLGRWPYAIPLAAGRRVAWATAEEALVRGPEGAAWYLVTPMGAGQAAELAGELTNTRGARVAWEDGLASVLVTSDAAQTLPGPAAIPAMPTAPLLALLRPDPSAQRKEVNPPPWDEASLPGLDAGGEMIRRVNVLRRGAGLAPIDGSAELGWAALGHCAWMDANPTLDAGAQVPRTPNFLGERPADRGGAEEFATRSPGATPPAAVDAWAASPFSRSVLLHPNARFGGACATPGGARVLELSVARTAAGWEARAYPTTGMTGVPTSFVGDDAVFRAVAGGAVGPFGFPITLWVPTPALGFQVQASVLLDGEGTRVDHLLVRGTELPGAIHAPDASVHLVARSPLRAGTTYAWEVSYTAGGRAGDARGRFQTAADPGGALAAVDPTAARVVGLLNDKRAQVRAFVPLVSTVSATQGARLVAGTRQGAGLDRLLPAGSAWYCAPNAWYQAWVNKGVDGFDANLDPIGTDARYGQVGAATLRGDLCLLFSREGGRTPR